MLPKKMVSVGPGPAKYLPLRSDNYGRNHVTFKSRISHKLESVGPGPAKFDLRQYRPGRQRPAWSMGRRTIAMPMILPGDNC